MLKRVGLVVLVAIGLGALALWWARQQGEADYYDLDVLNTGKKAVVVRVSLAPAEYPVAAGQAHTFRVEKQPAQAAEVEREFTVTDGEGAPRVLHSKVDYGRHVVLDVTGDNCIVAADYGAQYRAKDVKLPEGMRDISVVKAFRHQQIFLPATFQPQKGAPDVVISVGLGEKLPSSIKVSSRSSRTIHDVVRLLRVPCELVDKPNALYNYLHEH